MNHAKQFPTLLVASVCSGVALCDMKVEGYHEVATHILGRPVFTHELREKAIEDKLRETILAQFPNMPTPEDAAQSVEAAGGKAVIAYGDTVMVEPAHEVAKGTPLASLPDDQPKEG